MYDHKLEFTKWKVQTAVYIHLFSFPILTQNVIVETYMEMRIDISLDFLSDRNRQKCGKHSKYSEMTSLFLTTFFLFWKIDTRTVQA